MSGQVVRVEMKHVDEADEFIRMDLVLNGSKVKRGAEYFGMWYDKSDNSRCPFVVSPDGQLDYGYGYVDEDQYYASDLLDKDIVEGAEVVCKLGEDEFVYKIVGVSPLN